mmetsp:Transcript_4889/g.6945  ORF Transcript_4889/g.6945 Transcript_4889/m.6945 type:complete len:259 (-) Transcript_4889:306-1082(-)
MTVPLWMVGAYVCVFVFTVVLTYVMAYCSNHVDVLPLLCEAGSQLPAFAVVVYLLFLNLHHKCHGTAALALNLTALICGLSAGVGLILMSCFSIRGRFKKGHNTAVTVYLFGSLSHAFLVSTLSSLIHTTRTIRRWRWITTGAALLCVFAMWVARKVYVRAIRRQQPIYKNLFNGQPVSRVISSEGDLMGDLEYGHDQDFHYAHNHQLRHSDHPDSVNVPGDTADTDLDSVIIKRVWAGIQYLSVAILVGFQLTLVFE